MDSLISIFGIFVVMTLCWSMSPARRVVAWRVVVGGLALQFALAFLTLRTAWGQAFFQWAGELFNVLLGYVSAGSEFVFGKAYREHFFAFQILPTIIFFSALMSFLYYLGVMQALIRFLSDVMQKTLGTSGAETLSTSANIFVGQTEAPLVVKPYIGDMTKSELMTIMIGGFATTAGGVLAACVAMGMDASHLMAASVIAAPATIVVAKLMQPELETPLTLGKDAKQPESPAENAVHAITMGAGEGLSLAFNVAACLIVFIAAIAAINGVLGWICGHVGDWSARRVLAGDATAMNELPVAARGLIAVSLERFPDAVAKDWASFWTLERLFGYAFAPLAWCIGMSWSDALRVGELLGVRMISNELIAYSQLENWMKAAPDARPISDRAIILATYALSGFANFSSIGIQVGGIGPMAPHRQKDLARLGFRAMLGGTLATMMTACVAGVFLTDQDVAAYRKKLDAKASAATLALDSRVSRL
ncbi:MAG TPA: nucleoside transporter C-terminal domain-containing protein [Planctomycetia bacterium]|nr:nucleoside transporter C-terminal domain-containing protein [Planctomycetia bacterium]